MNNQTEENGLLLVRKGKRYRLTEQGANFIIRPEGGKGGEDVVSRWNVEAVAVQGAQKGDLLILYLKDSERKYTLAADSSGETIDDLFKGIERYNPPKKCAAPAQTAYNAPMGDQRGKMLKIGSGLDMAAFICAVLTVLDVFSPLNWIACILIGAVTVGYVIAYPQYFSLRSKSRRGRSGNDGRTARVGSGCIASAFAVLSRVLLDYCIFDWTVPVVIGLLGGLAMTAVMMIRSREAREHGMLLAAVFIVSAVAFAGAAGQINHLANIGAEPPLVCRVEDTDKSARSRHGGRRYSCEVELETGERLNLPVSEGEYALISPGDSVLVYRGKGALGVDYAYYAGRAVQEDE